MVKSKTIMLCTFFTLSMGACQNSAENHQKRDRELAKEQPPVPAGENLSNQVKGQTDSIGEEANHPDHDFVHFMISQHAVAITLAKEELNEGEDTKLKTVATHIMEHHQLEKDFLEKAVNRIDSAAEPEQVGSSSVLHFQLKTSIDKMQAGMGEMDQIKDVNLRFKNKIILHHQTSIEVAEAYIEYGKDKELLGYAERLVKDHKQEINLLQND